MPVRSLTSSVLRWPEAEVVDRAVRRWAAELGRQRPEVKKIGYFGSYARGDWGVGSDLDLIVRVDRSELPFYHRAAQWDTSRLPVPVDLFVYTEDEWPRVIAQGRFAEVLRREVVWVYRRAETSAL